MEQSLIYIASGLMIGLERNNCSRRHKQITNQSKTNELTKTFVEEILKFNKAHNIVGRLTESEINLLDVLDCRSCALLCSK